MFTQKEDYWFYSDRGSLLIYTVKNALSAQLQGTASYLYFLSVHGGWAQWEGWEGCSSPCGPGVAKRHRTCSNPTPSLYGRFCQGDGVDFDLCTGHDCGNISTTVGKHIDR